MERHGMVRVATCTPEVQVADCMGNVNRMRPHIEDACATNARIIVFPEMSITGYTCGDLFHDHHLQRTAIDALKNFACQNANMKIISIVGLPVCVEGVIYNCAAVVFGDEVLGIVPKSFIPNYKEFYEQRWFASGIGQVGKKIFLNNFFGEVPFGTDLLFKVHSGNDNIPEMIFGIEICEDLWGPYKPSSNLALRGANVLINISASNEVVGKSDYRRRLVVQQSGDCIAAYLYCSAGIGESTTDVVFSGHNIIAENGKALVESERFTGRTIQYADIDLQKLEHDRQVNTRFYQARQFVNHLNYRTIEMLWPEREASKYPKEKEIAPLFVKAHPFVPSDPAVQKTVCEEIFNIQKHGLIKRIKHVGLKKVVVAFSGGSDSTHALLVTVAAFDEVGLPRENILAITMPGFGTTQRTKQNAIDLCKVLGVTLEEIPIHASVEQHFKDIGHNQEIKNVVYENSQARARTWIAMDKGFVVGTGDLSELAKGWCTYNADHMSMYGVNSGVPKTLIRYLIDYVAKYVLTEATDLLNDILDTPISPELLPPDKNGNIVQMSEDKVGPYELTDFFLYNMMRFGMPPEKILFLARYAKFNHEYSDETLKNWLIDFYKRFFGQQFKRNCLPDGPKVGTISLSPRGDWRMPSDAVVKDWLNVLKKI